MWLSPKTTEILPSAGSIGGTQIYIKGTGFGVNTDTEGMIV